MADEAQTQPPEPAATPPPAGAPTGAGGGGGRTAALVVLAVVLIAGAGVSGYFIGKGAADASGAKKKGFAEGAASVRAQYRPGAPGYALIFAAGRASGSQSGRRTGLALGVKQGQAAGFERGHAAGTAQGVSDGANAALGNLPSWQTGAGAFYVVDMAPGTQSGVRYVVNGRQLMQANRLYEVCTDDPSQICSQTAPPK